MTTAELRARLEQIDNELRTIHEEAGDRPLNDEEQARWDALEAEERELKERLDELERRERVRAARAKWNSVQVCSPVERGLNGEDVTRLDRRAAADRARALLGEDYIASQLPDESRTRLERLILTRNDNVDGDHLARRILVTEDPDYREAFLRLVTRTAPVLSPEQVKAVQRWEEFRAMSIGTPAAGGYGVPVLLDPTIILTAQGSPNYFFQLARVETITTNEWKGVSSAGVTWQFRQEASPASDNSPTLAQPTVGTHRADGYIPYSFEVEQDYPGFASEMSRLLAEGYSELLVQKFTTGTGSNEPRGIVTALDADPSVEVATGTAGTLAGGDINKLWAELPIKYRNSWCAWMASTDVNGVIQQLGNNNSIASFTADFTAEGTMRLKGREFYLNDYMDPMPSGTTAANLVIVGDWRNYLIAQRAGMSIELVPHVFYTDSGGGAGVPTGQRAWYAWARVGADCINTQAFRLLQNKTE